MGHKHCDCRDCFETCIDSHMCDDCTASGCELDTECRVTWARLEDCDATNGVDDRLPHWQDRIGRR